MLSSSSSVFDNLPTRPPTPPREPPIESPQKARIEDAVSEAINFLDDSHDIERAIQLLQPGKVASDDTPNRSPSSSQEAAARSNAAKYVNFSPHITYHKVSRPGFSSSPNQQSSRKLPSSRGLQPLKSILKPWNVPPPPTPEELETKLSYFSPEEPGSFAKMLQSVIQQLASTSISSRLDAYLALNGTLKAYEGVPDPSVMAAKMGILQQFVTRDMAWKDPDGILDANIVTQALKLTIAMMFDSRLSKAFDDDFRAFLIDRSITVMEATDMPKAIVKTHLYLVAQQRFSRSIITTSRAERILSALLTIETRCSGNNVVATRLVTYQRLLDQAPAIMLNRLRDWFPQVVHGMLSSINEVRSYAIESCTTASLMLGSNPTASKAVQDFFETEVDDGQCYFDYLNLRLTNMVKQKEVGMSVPRIWSAVILFFRNKKRPLDLWPRFKSWLVIMQRCLNASDIEVKQQAHLAWNKLVFALMPSASSTVGTLPMLKIPICAAFERQGRDTYAKHVKRFALDSYCNLLHYCLRPGLSYEELDTAWAVLVEPILLDVVKASRQGRSIANRIVKGLLSGNIGIWNEQAALEPTPIRPEDLPKLDPRWVRSRIRRVLDVVEPLVSATVWSTSDDSVLGLSLWEAMLKSVSEAGSQEVRASTELKQAIAAAINALRRFWLSNELREAVAIPGNACIRYQRLAECTVGILGPNSFTEEMLVQTEREDVEAALTPSHRASKHHQTLLSPLVSFLAFLCPRTQSNIDIEDRRNVASSILRLCCASKTTPLAKLQLVRKTFQRVHTIAKDHENAAFWVISAILAAETLDDNATSSPDRANQEPGLYLREGLQILTAGLSMSNDTNELAQAGVSLCTSLLQSARSSAGGGGVILAIIEPLAKELNTNLLPKMPLTLRLALGKHLLDGAPWPATRQIIEQGREALWAVSNVSHRASLFDPFDQLYVLLDATLAACYSNIESDEVAALIPDVIESTTTFLSKCPIALLPLTLKRIENGLTVLIKDVHGKVFCKCSSATPQSIVAIWAQLLRMLTEAPSKDSDLLKAVGALLSAGLLSPRRAIVNDTVQFWNASFGLEDALEYPPQLEVLLRSLQSHVELTLPTFPESNEGFVPLDLPTFAESQDESVLANSAVPRLLGSTRDQTADVPTPDRIVKSAFFNVSRQSLPTPAHASRPASAVKQAPKQKAKLRHDDSQIQFAPIESSPVPPSEESQLLTERQREVKARQAENAQQFPDLSSSPLAQSTALQRKVPRRLDFTSDPISSLSGEDAVGTPIELPEANGGMSDYMGSSPTPQASDKGVEAPEESMLDREQMDENTDPPSSPPREDEDFGTVLAEDGTYQYNVGPNEPTLDATVAAKANEALPPSEKRMVDHSKVLQDDDARDSDLPSDTVLPDEQLQTEQQAAEDHDQVLFDAADNEVQASGGASPTPTVKEKPQAQLEVENLTSDAYVDAPTEVQPATPSKAGQSSYAAALISTEVPHVDNEEEAKERFETVNANEDGEVTRVENSFIESANPAAQPYSPSNADSQQSQQRKRKRKSSEIVYTAKKQRKQQSPFKRFFSSFLSRSQQEEDDGDIGEEIVVASSQVQSSPASNAAQQATSSPSKLVDVQNAAEEEPAALEERVVVSTEPPPKRGPGRPRRSDRLSSSQSQHGPTTGLKRKRSTLSQESSPSSEVLTSFVKDTPAPSKVRKQRDKQDTKETKAAQASQEDEENSQRLTRRTATAVVVEDDEAREVEAEIEDNDTPRASPEKQLHAEASAAVQERPVASPRSMLGRLRDMLGDFKKVILGPQEEREFDDTLFLMRREVHEAARRGREQA